ncbi:unconventional myosin-XVIIIb-like [Schistosoma japonicum]|nr:unconventional myosin-XVIIIb-like [Schistosoma japonicum]
MDKVSTGSKLTQELPPDSFNKHSITPSNNTDLNNITSVYNETAKISSNDCQLSNDVNSLNELILQQSDDSDKFVSCITSTTNNILHSMDDLNMEKKKVTINEPTDKLSRDIQLKAEQILFDLRSLPLKYQTKRNKKYDAKRLETTLLKDKPQGKEDNVNDDEYDDEYMTAGASNCDDNDSVDNESEIPNDKNESHSHLMKSSNKSLDSIRQTSDLLKIRCDMLQTYIKFLEARKCSLENSVNELNQQFDKNHQIQNRTNERESNLDVQQLEELLTNQNIALAREKEQSTQFRLKYESVEAARFALSQQLQLTSSEYDADKTFYQKQIKQLEQEIQERINKANEVKRENEQLQNEVLDFKKQINSLEDELKRKQFEINVVSQCYDEKMKNENEQHDLEVMKLQKEINDLSIEKFKESTKYESEINALTTHLKLNQSEIQDLLHEKENLCKQLQDITHKLNISSQEKEELQKKTENDLLKIKQEKDNEFAEIQRNLNENHMKKLNEMQTKFDKDIEMLKQNHQAEIEKLKIDLKDTESLKRQLMCYVHTLENCVYNSPQHKRLSNQHTQTDKQFKPVEFLAENTTIHNFKDVSAEPRLSGTILSLGNVNKNRQSAQSVISADKSTETSPIHLDSSINNHSVQLIKEKDHQRIIDNYESKLSQLHLCLHQLYHDHDTIIHLFNNTIYGIIQFGNRECNRFSKFLNITNHEIEIPSSLLHSRVFYPLKPLNGNENIPNLTENNLIIKSWINPLIDVIGKLSAYCIRVCDLIESQQEHLEWQSKNVNELHDITKKQIELQNKQLIKTRKANLNRLRSCLKQKQSNRSLNEVNSIISKNSPDSYPILYNDSSSDKILLPIKDIGSKYNYNLFEKNNSMYSKKPAHPDIHFNEKINKPIGVQHQNYSPVCGLKGLFNKSPPLRLLHSNTNISPYDNIKSFSNNERDSENSYDQSGLFSSSFDLDSSFMKWLNAAYRRHTSTSSLMSNRLLSMKSKSEQEYNSVI